VLAELRAELREQEHGLERLKRELSKEERKRRADIEKELDSLREAHDEVDRLDEEYERLRLRKDRKEQEVKEQRRRRDEAWDRLEKKKSEMSKQYELKFREADKREKDLIGEKKRLEQQMQASWGDQLREAKRRDESWAWWCSTSMESFCFAFHHSY
jgi:chromosome segregation ATPase